jgi:hypothetical protein
MRDIAWNMDITGFQLYHSNRVTDMDVLAQSSLHRFTQMTFKQHQKHLM